jgi:hypothetical protein
MSNGNGNTARTVRVGGGRGGSCGSGAESGNSGAVIVRYTRSQVGG